MTPMAMKSLRALSAPLGPGIVLAQIVTLVALAPACGGSETPGADGSDASAPDAGQSPDGGFPAGARAHSGGDPREMEVVGDLAYVTVGPRLTIWRVTAGSGVAPELVGESEPLSALLSDVAVAGTRAFVTDNAYPVGRIHVLDLSDPAHPVETTSFTLTNSPTATSRPRGMAFDGDRMYVADVDLGIVEVDVSDPDAPSGIRIVSVRSAASLDVVGRRLYRYGPGIPSSVGALDLDADLADLGSTSVEVSSARVAPGDLLVAVGVDGVLVDDVSNLAVTAPRFRDSSPSRASFNSIAASGAATWIAADDGIHVLDLADPAAITRSGPFLPESAGGALAVHDGDATLLEVTEDGRLLLIDASDASAAPVLRGASDVTLCSFCNAVAASGDLLVASDFIHGLRTASLADLVPTGRASRLEGLSVFEDVVLSDGLAYVADRDFGLRVYDLADPTAPALIGQLATGPATSIAVVGTRVYLGESGGGALRIIDAAEPAAPRELGSIITDDGIAVDVRGDVAVYAESSFSASGGLRLFDVSDPALIVDVGAYRVNEGCSDPRDVALTGSLAVVACGSDGFHIVDISDPARPVRRAIIPAFAVSVAAWEGSAALGDSAGVEIIDLADSSAPVALLRYPTADVVSSLAGPADGHIVAACNGGGIYRFQLPVRSQAR